ncbi:hypothetical protein BC831DRAFT_460058 [Entophlyctis helioformis]|nr:hypothetical protein BC831DRAFT_460058 [Entophlyctis helioformis]
MPSTAADTATMPASDMLTSASAHPKPFKCDMCHSTFSRNHDLKRHIRIHLGIRPFKCDLCSKSFTRMDALHRHTSVRGCKTSAMSGKGPDDMDEDTVASPVTPITPTASIGSSNSAAEDASRPDKRRSV